MEPLKLWYTQILGHIKNTGLVNLQEYKPKVGESFFSKFTEITRSKAILKPFSYSDFKHLDEFLFLSQDFIYIISVIENLHPSTNNIIKENGTYNQTLEDHLYLRYSGFGFQVIYSYWDRIGDLLSFFFKTGQSGDVYLSRVLNNFPQEYKTKTFNKLYDLYKNQVEHVLIDRHGIVHTFGLKSKYFWELLEKNQDVGELEKLQEEKDNFPHLFRQQLQFFFIGFDLTMELISELPDEPKSLI